MLPDRRYWLLRTGLWAAGLFTLVMAFLPHPPVVPGLPSEKLHHMLRSPR